MRPVPLLVALLALAGCGAPEATEEPGARGPVVMRWWDRQALERRAEPTVLTTDTLAEIGTRFSALAMTPVLVRHPLPDGVVWLEAPTGSFNREASATSRLHCPGPVHLSGWLQGRPVSGAADEAIVQAGGRDLELTNLGLVQGGRLTTTPRAALSQGRGHGDGPFRILPGAPAVLAALAAVPDRK